MNLLRKITSRHLATLAAILYTAALGIELIEDALNPYELDDTWNICYTPNTTEKQP